jgi:outer membrane protein OmpA-like peptidoglycan-associated protein
MKVSSITAAVLLAVPLWEGTATLASAREVRMFDTPPSVEELQQDLAPHRTRSIEIPGVPAQAALAPERQSAAQVTEEPAKPAPVAAKAAVPEKTAKAAAPEKEKAAAKPVTVGFHIQFAYNSAQILAESRPFLDQLGKVMKVEPRLSVAIEGHTDAKGGDAYNMALSKRRAESVKAYLAETWTVDPSRMTVEGKGKSEPLVADPYAAANRRVQFRPLDGSEPGAEM